MKPWLEEWDVKHGMLGTSDRRYPFAAQRSPDEDTNARMQLAAAAPDLYRAVEALLKFHTVESGDGSVAVWDQAYRALEKARGEPR